MLYRHHIPRLLVSVLFLVLLLGGCGGSGSDTTSLPPSSEQSSTALSSAVAIGPEGGTAYDEVAVGLQAGAGTAGSSRDIEVEFPRGTFTAATEVILGDRFGAAAPPNSSVPFSHAHTIQFSRESLSPGDVVNLVVHFPYHPRPNYRAALGYYHDGVMVAYPALSTSSGIEGTVSLDQATTHSEKGAAVSAELSMLEIPESAELQGDPPMAVSVLELDSVSATYRWSAYEGAWTGQKIALLVHGIKGSSADLLALAVHLRNKGSYDSIYAVDYKLGYHIDTLGTKLASVISARAPSGIKIDVLAHSMGGLVSRSAIENHGTAQQTARFVALGSPHNGVTVAFYLSLIASGFFEHLVPEINDLSPDSTFLKTLNSGARVDCAYFGAVGTDPGQLTTYWTVKYFGNTLVRLLIGGRLSSVVDGMVGAESAGYDISGKCTTWTTQTFPVSHAYIRGGDQGQQLYDKVFDQVDQWLSR